MREHANGDFLKTQSRRRAEVRDTADRQCERTVWHRSGIALGLPGLVAHDEGNSEDKASDTYGVEWRER